tara:strand:- start:174 stop:608 length:435 start_codon:yes stop_codon:yes gene_type:complete
MEIKNIPTDNLYKFITIFSIALMLACAYAFTSIYDSHLREYQTIKLKAIELEAIEKPTSPQELTLKYYRDQMIRNETDKKTLMFWPAFGFVISICGAVWGFWAWKKNLQVYLDRQIKYETISLRREVRAANKASKRDALSDAPS